MLGRILTHDRAARAGLWETHGLLTGTDDNHAYEAARDIATNSANIKLVPLQDQQHALGLDSDPLIATVDHRLQMEEFIR